MIQEIKNISTTQPVQQNKLELNEAKITMGEEIVNGDKVSLSAEEIEGIIKELNQFIQIFNTKIAFEIDKETKKTILRIVDVETNEVIRQIPPEELLHSVELSLLHNVINFRKIVIDLRCNCLQFIIT